MRLERRRKGAGVLESNNLGASLPLAVGSGTLLQRVIGALHGNSTHILHHQCLSSLLHSWSASGQCSPVTYLSS